MGTIHRYILREIAVPFGVGLSVFTFVLLIARLMKLIELVVNRGLPPLTIVELFGYILPAFLEVTVPMAMLLAILVAFGRLSTDSEITALRSSGVSLYQLLPSVAVFVVLATLVTFGLSAWARPWGNRMLRTTLWDLARTRASAGLTPQVFNSDFPGLVIYTEQIDARSDRLVHVLISDERASREHNVIFAREGLMVSDPETQTLTLRLVDGWMHTSDPERAGEYQTDFRTYDVHLDLRQALAGVRQHEIDPKELTPGELRAAIATKHAAGQPYGSELVEYHRKLSIPFACIVFGLVGMPLGVTPARAVRSRGFAVSLGLIFVYYIFLSAGQALAEQELLPAGVALWLPNVVFLALGVMLFRRAARERPIEPLGVLANGVGWLRTRLGAATT